MSKLKLYFKVGINDANYPIKTVVDGENVECQYFIRWKKMLERCYSDSLHKRHPTYKGCTVTPEWLSFTNFKTWMEAQDWEGKQLDKDIIIPGNKIYSPETCAFVSKQVNTMINDCAAKESPHPKGVVYDKNPKRKKKFNARCNYKGKNKSLGYFETVEEAAKAYRDFKSKILIEASEEQSDDRVKQGLLLHASLIKESK